VSWRTAKALLQLRREANAYRPGRSTVSDGTIGDADHQTRTSDHNPWVPPPAGGVVTAMDITDDAGTLTKELAEILRAGRDPRIKYVIGERRMFSSYPTSSAPAWTWRPYSGANAHTSHMHVSVQPQPDLFDSTAPWGIAEATGSLEEDAMRQGDSGATVRAWQTRLTEWAGIDVATDGQFGPKTAAATRRWQEMAGLEQTGEVDAVTAMLLGATRAGNELTEHARDRALHGDGGAHTHEATVRMT
jgi:hypothetical protein